MFHTSRAVWLSILLLAFLPIPPATACDIYWAQDDGIYRAHADGSDVQELVVPGVNMDIDISPDEGRVYFMDLQNIRRVGLDGTGLETVFSHPTWIGWSFDNNFMAIDSVHQTIYHTYGVFDGSLQDFYQTMACRTFDGVGCGGSYGDDGVAVDPLNGWVYVAWGGIIRRSTLDGSDSERWFDADNWVQGLALDQKRLELYWTEPGPGRILRLPTESPTEEAVEILAGLGNPRDVAVDPSHRHVYWIDTDTGKIQRASVDRPIVQDVITGISSLHGLTVDPRSVDLRMHRDELFWEPLQGTLDYDVVRGDLQTLRDTAGDFEAATMDCLANDTPTTGVELSEGDPDPGESFWYLARAGFVGYVSGSYGGCDSSQLAPRDAGLDQSAVGCP